MMASYRAHTVAEIANEFGVSRPTTPVGATAPLHHIALRATAKTVKTFTAEMEHRGRGGGGDGDLVPQRGRVPVHVASHVL